MVIRSFPSLYYFPLPKANPALFREGGNALQGAFRLDVCPAIKYNQYEEE